MRTLLFVLVSAVFCSSARAGPLADEISDYLTAAGNEPGPAPVLAATDADPKWRYGVALYLWAAGMKGDVAVRGVSVPVDLRFDEIVENLDFAFMLHATAKKGRWGMFLDLAYIDLGVDTTGPLGGAASVESKLFFGEFAGTFEFWGDEWSETSGIVTEAYAGLRVYAADTELELPVGEIDQSDSWVDPIVGIGAYVHAGKWDFGARGDVGGFGAGSDLAWSVLVAARYRFTDLFSMGLGYRWLDIDYSRGSGNDAFALDVLMHGPFLAFIFSF